MRCWYLMEILFVSHKYPPSTGGMEKQSYELINGMKRFATVHTLVYAGKGSKALFFLTLNRNINKACRRHPGITIIHFNDGLIASFCLLHKGYEHLNRTVTLHGLDIVFPSQFFRRRILPEFNNFSLIFAVSRATANACCNLGLSPGKIVVVNNGVDSAIASTETSFSNFISITNKYKLPINNKSILVAMGRPVKRKGFSWFIENIVPRLEGEVVLLIIGPFNASPPFLEKVLGALPGDLQKKIELFLGYPSDERVIRKLLVQPAFADKVRHLGKLSFNEIIQILNRADAFVMPNIRAAGDMEGFGLVCLEASLCGATVFASKVDGIPDAIHDGKNGFLLPPGNIRAWATLLNDVIAEPSKNCLNREAVKLYTLQNFNWDKMVRLYWEHFNNI